MRITRNLCVLHRTHPSAAAQAKDDSLSAKEKFLFALDVDTPSSSKKFDDNETRRNRKGGKQIGYRDTNPRHRLFRRVVCLKRNAILMMPASSDTTDDCRHSEEQEARYCSSGCLRDQDERRAGRNGGSMKKHYAVDGETGQQRTDDSSGD